MRHCLIHAYFEINLDILWETVVTDLPPLIASLDNILPPEGAAWAIAKDRKFLAGIEPAST
jgi:Ribonuclease HepT-like